MIHAIVFDLDGVLIQIEKLKAMSYAVAVQQILNLPEPDRRAIDAYKEVVGATREVASKHILEKLKLEKRLRPLISKYGRPHEILTKIRLSIYSRMVADPKVIRENQWPHTLAVLRASRKMACRTGLATMSTRKEALHVIRSLQVERFIDEVVTAEDIQHGKPDPEVYLVAVKKLDVGPADTLVLEDSINGIRAAFAAGTKVIAVATPFTNCNLRLKEAVKMVGKDWIVHDPEQVARAVIRRIREEMKSVSTV